MLSATGEELKDFREGEAASRGKGRARQAPRCSRTWKDEVEGGTSWGPGGGTEGRAEQGLVANEFWARVRLQLPQEQTGQSQSAGSREHPDEPCISSHFLSQEGLGGPQGGPSSRPPASAAGEQSTF